METPEPTPQEALELLRQFIAHPGIRCFNLQEYDMARRALAILEKATAEPREARMSITVIKEDGTGLANANSYASVADGDAYHAGHLYATAWTYAADPSGQDIALVMATRLIDAQYQFNGVRAHETQALQWPRRDCRDPDADGWNGGTVPDSVVPKSVVDATCELARELLIADRTASPPGEGLKYTNVGTTQTGYDKKDTRPIISHVAQAMLGKFGSMTKARSGAVRLVRS